MTELKVIEIWHEASYLQSQEHQANFLVLAAGGTGKLKYLQSRGPGPHLPKAVSF